MKKLIITTIALLVALAIIKNTSVQQPTTQRQGPDRPAVSVSSTTAAAITPPIATPVPQVVQAVPASSTNWRQLPDEIEVSVLPNLPLTFRKVSSSDDGKRKTWIGSNAGYNLVYCATEKLLDGVVTFPSGESFTIHASDAGVTITEDTDGPCGVEDIAQADAITQTETNLPCGTMATSTDRIYYYDILFLYTTGSKATWGSTADEVSNKYNAFIAASNLALSSSKITNFRFRCVGVAEVTTDTFTQTTSTHSMLDSLVALSGATYGGEVSPLSTFATAQRNALGADVVQMVLTGTKYEAAGLAYVGGEYSTVYEATSWKTVGHELGHTIGCNHDRITDKTPDTDTNYNYGYMVKDSSSVPTYHGDIMSYAGDRLAYFSNPDVIATATVWNTPKNNQPLVGETLDIAIGASNANNARFITEQAPTVTLRRQNTAGPVIKSQPASVTAVLGTDVTVSVTATGDSLTYQWFKNSVAITGANTSTLTLPMTMASDAAGYSVVVTNSIDTVTSNTATVTLTTPPAPTPAAPAPAPGGGGAFGLEYLLALLGAAGLRYLTRRR